MRPAAPHARFPGSDRLTIRASIVGASGYSGGELIRLLLSHPEVSVTQVTSRSQVGRPIHFVHPNLRGCSSLAFTPADDLEPVDVLFLCLPHTHAAGDIDSWRAKGKLVIDLSADFRLRDPAAYAQWYEWKHPSPGMLNEAVYGLPEISRSRLAGAHLISGVGCNATAMILALLPLARAGLVESAVADIKVGSSEGGAEASQASHHPERSRAVRTYSTAGHRHLAEVQQAIPEIQLDATITAIEMVRGVLCTAHVRPTRTVNQRDLFRIYREAYADEPFVRIVCDRAGLHRLPDPHILAGSNFADVGFAVDERSGRIIALAAIDNLMKGAAGSAVQSMNIALGFPETTGLSFPGLHPA
jgi:N-acetyl-gamma-glutamyl-phosphate/LysW-gamma-L-alpha-aminoadipyl-6-phosphate reductase